MQQGVLKEASKTGVADARAFAAGYAAWYDQLPPDMQRMLDSMGAKKVLPQDIKALPAPTTAKSYAYRLKHGRHASIYPPMFLTRWAIGDIALQAAGLETAGTQSGMWMWRAATGFAIMTGAQAGYKGAMYLGLADGLAHAIANPTAAKWGGRMVRLLINSGYRMAGDLGDLPDEDEDEGNAPDTERSEAAP
jgi:hypothetical protein